MINVAGVRFWYRYAQPEVCIEYFSIFRNKDLLLIPSIFDA